ncbi:MAG TPA: ABC transporter substrate-binding protein [Anaerolineae bacterium]|nr:ABC transporter substrate-binding protein [Anaerolineae bacterium]
MEQLNRRDFLRMSAVAAAGAVVAACAQQTAAPTTAPAATAIPAATNTTIPTRAATNTPVPTPVEIKESPQSIDLVKAGTLPSLAERLPQNSLVISMPWQGPGKYGGRMRVAHETWMGGNQEESMYGNSPLRWVDDGLGIDQGWAERWESNEDKSEWTFYTRKGLKWSDGEPFGVDDLLYWWEDLVLNPEQATNPPDEAYSGFGSLCDFIKVDDYTFMMSFDAPAPLTADRLAMWVNGDIGPRWIAPRHYLEQFHPTYNSAVKDFVEHDQKIQLRQNPDCPTLSHFGCDAMEDGVYVTWGRNHYYYCVDPDGNQLPYMDGCDDSAFQDAEARKAAILAGQSDFAWHSHGFGMPDVATLKAAEGQMGSELVFWDSGSGTGSMFFLSQDYREDKYRELFRDKRFQRACSHAWNREQTQKLVYFGTGELTSGTMSPKAIEYQFNDEAKDRYVEWRDAFVTYDPEMSKELLAEIGLEDSNDDGFLEFPDGSELLIRFDDPGDPGSEHGTKNELLAKDFNAVGIKTMMNPIPSGASEMWWAGEKMTNCAWEVGDGPNHLVYPSWVVPNEHDRWAPLQGQWYALSGTPLLETELDAEPWDRSPPRMDAEPGGPVAQLWELYDQSRIEPDTIARHHLVWDMMKIHVDEGPFFMGCVANYPRICLQSLDLRNCPKHDDLKLGGFGNPWIHPTPAVYNPEMWYYEDPEAHGG